MKILYQLPFPGVEQQKSSDTPPFYPYLMGIYFH